MSIYTKNGDTGFASTVTRKMIPKNSPIFSLLGTFDELNSALGVARNKMSAETGEIVRSIQQDIISFCTELAGGERFATKDKVAGMEKSIDLIMESVPQITAFITPGDSAAGAALDMARTVARRAERELFTSKQTGGITREAMMWANRLSDLIYAIARLMDAKTAGKTAGDSPQPEALKISSQPVVGVRPGISFMETGLWLCRQVLEKAKEMGIPVVTAACDAGGNSAVLLRADGAYIASVDIAQNKAFTSVSVQMSTEQLGTLSQPNGPLYGIQNTNAGRIVIFGGGIPLYENGTMIGGFGVSGGSAEQDTALAHYAKDIFENK
jgi:ATP:cob(I)alamin adenosyltransferase